MSIKKINVLSRNPDHYLRETKHDIHKVQRNYDPSLHPFEASREYKLALNSVKLERVFAKPFVGSLTHTEGVSALCRHPSRLSCVFTGTVEGELRLWDISHKKCEWTVQAHGGQIWSIVAAPDGNSFFTVGNDKTIKKWSLDKAKEGDHDLPVDTWLSDCYGMPDCTSTTATNLYAVLDALAHIGKTIVTGITHHRYRNEFITCGERVLLWDASNKAPKFSYDWSTSGDRNDASVASIKFNPVETDLFASSDYANNLVLYDTRAKEVKKLKMNLRINALAWNPMEAFILTAASEDYNPDYMPTKTVPLINHSV
ncbi:DDB1- and CUL4-associated factor 13 [Portunus trituberculatus]|uniref:DDB1-and CUL4-associated factor 13 n=1 Tax=Portunus trituberculatus TaxID=210409 RepID=A0A5B7CJH8_PORTR|nr:DDB1- and CUL4-associated factor 13 [Portunus trituberculatus]